MTEVDIEAKLNEAEVRAWQSLARYKFLMFGYWAAVYVHFNKLRGMRRPNPFAQLVAIAQERVKGGESDN